MTSAALTTVRELLPLITSLRDETESQRRLAPGIVAALRDARLGRVALPRALGGLELPPHEALQVYEALSGAEASVGWIVWNNALPCFFGRFLPPRARAEIFGDPDWLYAGSTRPSGRAAVEGAGFRVTGRWSLVSGCELAEWLGLRCVVEQDGQPRMLAPNAPEARIVFVRRADVRILDTWHTGGLRGTGSHDVVLDGLQVPREHTCSPMDGSSLDGALGRVPIVCNMAAGYGAQLLGIGRACVDAFVELARHKPVVDPGPALGERPAALSAVATQRAALDAARTLLLARVEQLWSASEAGGFTTAQIAAVFSAAHHAMAAGRVAVNAMYSLAGASALYTSSPLERAHRDVHAMAAHVIAQPTWLEDVGRVEIGAKPVNPLFLV